MLHDHLKLAVMEERARAILGISIGADKVEIKKAYWMLAMKYHPDKNTANKSLQNKFAVISQAYEILTSTKNMETRRLEDSDVRLFARDSPIDYYQWWKERFLF